MNDFLKQLRNPLDWLAAIVGYGIGAAAANFLKQEILTGAALGAAVCIALRRTIAGVLFKPNQIKRAKKFLALIAKKKTDHPELSGLEASLKSQLDLYKQRISKDAFFEAWLDKHMDEYAQVKRDASKLLPPLESSE